jgi:hypothetical protein
MIRRNLTLLVITLVAIQQSTVFAFHASLPNRAASMVRSDDRTSSSSRSGVDIIIILRAKLSADEAAERMQQQQRDREVMEQEQPPSLFEPKLVAEMNAAYNILEKRVLEGPGSLQESEIDELEVRFQKIILEMKLNEHNRPKKASTISRDGTGGATIIDAAPMSTIRKQQQNGVSLQQQHQPTSAPSESLSSYKIPNSVRQATDTSQDDDGVPEYDGTGGMGQPRGTVNTYAIEGMEEMSSDEYMAALQDRVINTQRERRRSGQAGSRGSWSYLNSLSGNSNGILNKKEEKSSSKLED